MTIDGEGLLLFPEGLIRQSSGVRRCRIRKGEGKDGRGREVGFRCGGRDVGLAPLERVGKLGRFCVPLLGRGGAFFDVLLLEREGGGMEGGRMEEDVDDE